MNLQPYPFTPAGNDRHNGVETWWPMARARARQIVLAHSAIKLGTARSSFDAGQPVGARPL